MSSLFSIAAAIAAGYLFIAGWVYLRQDAMVYQPLPELLGSPADFGLEYEEAWLKTSDGVDIHGWFVPGRGAVRRVLLFCHGNAGNISHRLDSLKIFHDLGLSVFIFDYRGFGKSRGQPNEKGTYLDAETAWDHLLARGYGPEEIFIFGRSLGGAVAAYLAAGKDAAALILESTFTSLPDVGAAFYPYLPVRLLARHRYETITHLRKVRCPVLVVHSIDDEMIPFSHGQSLFATASNPKTFLEISGGHNHGFLISGQHYVEGLRAFLREFG
ncbi:MAG TPA: alpha/beta hydrolase [Desulfonatronum sp.]|nr:alpha/beta hydrolase [Desulfonatronum sp.]